MCKEPFPTLTMVIEAGGGSVSLDLGATVVGRVELGGSLKVSARHAVFRRIGPETWIESCGSNGVYRWSGSGWSKLSDNKPVLVQSGDRMRLADVEVQLQ
jgi:hypothetical protein